MRLETVISSNSEVRLVQYLRDVWSYRDLFRAFVERDIKMRYKQTVLGVLWVIVPPLLNSGIFYIIFVRVVEMPTQGLPPLLFFLSALIPWNCFANGLSQASSSLEGSSGLISKVYFPRIIVPMATILASLFDFMLGWIFFNIVAIGFGLWTWLFIPFTIVLLSLQVGVCMGLGLALSVLNAQFRDIRYVIPVCIQIAMWLTPVIWPMERLLRTRFGSQLEFFLYVNPMAGVIESYRALLAGTYIPWKLLGGNFLMMIVVLILGIYIFRRREREIIDLL
jgi:lipopolysaccharide transport system permease protein